MQILKQHTKSHCAYRMAMRHFAVIGTAIMLSLIPIRSSAGLLYSQTKEIVAFINPVTLEQTRFMSWEKPETYESKGYLPVYVEIKESRFSGTKLYRIWKGDLDEDEWWEGTEVVASGSGPYKAIRGSLFQGSRDVRLFWPASIAKKVHSGLYGLIKAKVLKNEWVVLRKGEKVTGVSDAKRITIDNDSISLNLEIEFENSSDEREILNPSLFVLTSQRKLLLQEFKLIDEEMIKQKKYYANEIVLEPKQKKTVKLVTPYVEYSILSKFKQVEIEHMRRGWRWETPKLPNL